MRMKWSNENFMRQCEIADKKLEYERELTIIDEYALNLRDCRDMYSRLENYGRTQFCLGCEQHARRVAELESQLKTAMSLLIDYQAIANGSTHERATLAAKVSDWLMKQCADGTWRQLQQDETLDNQTVGETAERENHD